MDNKKLYDELIKILLKKANGFYYTEEQQDYEKTQNKSQSNEITYQNVSFFENIDMVNNNSNKTGVKIKSSNGTQKIQENNSNLALVKKKITTHYIPPDMLAVKILFETIKEKVNDDNIENLSDDELIKLKNKILEELNDED